MLGRESDVRPLTGVLGRDPGLLKVGLLRQQ